MSRSRRLLGFTVVLCVPDDLRTTMIASLARRMKWDWALMSVAPPLRSPSDHHRMKRASKAALVPIGGVAHGALRCSRLQATCSTECAELEAYPGACRPTSGRHVEHMARDSMDQRTRLNSKQFSTAWCIHHPGFLLACARPTRLAGNSGTRLPRSLVNGPSGLSD